MKALLVIALLAGMAHAETGADIAWKTTRGSFTRGMSAGTFVIASDGAPGRYSEAAMITALPIALPYTLTAKWRRLGPEAGRSMHVLVAGGIVLIKSGAIAFYAYDDTAFAQGEWKPIANHLAEDEHAIRIEQDHQRVIVMLDGAEVARYELPLTRESANVGFGMKSAPGLRSEIYVRDIAIAHQSQ